MLKMNRTRRMNRVLALGAVTSMMALASTAQAAPIIFSAPTNTTADTDVMTLGTLVTAYNATNVNRTVNTVLFTGTNSFTTWGSIAWTGLTANNTSTFNDTDAPFSTLSATYRNILVGASYNSGAAATATISGLTVGHRYAVQTWVSDPRTAGVSRTQTITGGGNTVQLDFNSTDNSATGGGVGQYAIGTFTADSTSQAFTLDANNTLSTQSTQVNAIQVRNVTNLGYWTGRDNGGAVLGTLDSGTSLNWATNIFSAALTSAVFDTAKVPLNGVVFADAYYSSSVANAVGTGNVTVNAAGVSTGTVTFANNTQAYSLTNASGTTGITGATNVVIEGPGAVTFNSANSYTGTTNIYGGSLRIANASALGTTAAGTTVTGGALELSGNITTTAEALTLNGTGISSGGALRNVSGNNTYAGTITLGSASRINSDSGTLTLDVASGNAITATNLGLTVGGAGSVTINDVADLGTAGLTKDGNGTLTLAAANTYGATTISAGTVTITNANALGTGNVSIAGTLNVNAPGNSTIEGLNTANISGAGTINVNGLGTGSNSTIMNGNFSGFNGTINIGPSAAAGSGKVQMNGLDHTDAVINVGAHATLYVTGNVTKNAEIFLNGGDTGESLGQLRLESGANWAGTVTIAGNMSGTGDSAIGSNSGTSTISGQITQSGGTRALRKNGAGIIVLTNNSNNFTGNVTIHDGSLRITQSGALGTGTKSVFITNNVSGAAPKLRLDGTGGPITLASTISFLTSGNIIINEAGNNVINGNFQMTSGNGNTTITSNAGSLTLNGTMTFTAADRDLVVDGTAGGTINGNILKNAQANVDLTKNGTGTWTLASTGNTYDETKVLNGILNVTGSLSSNDASRVFITKDANDNFDVTAAPELQRAVGALTSLAGYGATEVGGLNTVASLIGGSTNAATVVDMAFRGRNNAIVAGETSLLSSDILRLEGLDGVIFVLQMSYSEAAALANGQAETSLKLGYLNTTLNRWEDAIFGNNGTNTGIFYTSSFADAGSPLALGSHGVDVVNNVVWAVLDHNSFFAVIPTPGALPAGMLLMGLVIAAKRRRQA
jgi:autotransporter-associated beta strand protein